MLKTVQVNSSETSPFNDQLHKLAEDKYSKLHLKILKRLTDDEVEQLGGFIENQKPFPYTKLSLKVDLNILKNRKFLENLQKLNSTLISGVELIFTTEEVKQSYLEIIDTLIRNVAPKVFYPIQIQELDAEKIVSTKMDLQDFQKRMITNIQKRNTGELDLPVIDTPSELLSNLVYAH